MIGFGFDRWCSPRLHSGGSPDDSFRVLEARRTLELRLVQQAAFRATDDDFAALQESIDLLAATRDELTRADEAEPLFRHIMWHPILTSMPNWTSSGHFT
jgi:DNA-binding FadR family transcriptional regulator